MSVIPPISIVQMSLVEKAVFLVQEHPAVQQQVAQAIVGKSLQEKPVDPVQNSEKKNAIYADEREQKKQEREEARKRHLAKQKNLEAETQASSGNPLTGIIFNYKV